MAVAMPIARPGEGRPGKRQRRSAGEDDQMSHIGFLEDDRRANERAAVWMRRPSVTGSIQ
jgi:hypothetical protein